MTFLQALSDNTFLQYALIIGVLTAISCGITGTFVVTKKITFLSGGIAHAVVGGLGLVYFFNNVYNMNVPPIYGALLAALAAAIIIGLINLYSLHNADTIIGAVWAFGMAVGLIFMSKTPGYNTDLMSYLFGSILMVSTGDLILLSILAIITIIFGLLFYHKLSAICFDEEFAAVMGVNVTFYYLFLLCLTSFTIVALIQVVGLILVIALLSIPAAIAKMHAKKISSMMFIAIILGVLFTGLGIWLSYIYDIPAGSTIILVATFAFALDYLLFSKINSIGSH